MIRWIRELLGLCDHKWVIIREANLYKDHRREGRFPYGHEYHLQCERCGNIKIKRSAE